MHSYLFPSITCSYFRPSTRTGHRHQPHSGKQLRPLVSLRPRGTDGQQRLLRYSSNAHLEGIAEAPRLLKSRTKHLVSSNIGIGDGSSSESHCLDH
jgi:hypothetical protein